MQFGWRIVPEFEPLWLSITSNSGFRVGRFLDFFRAQRCREINNHSNALWPLDAHILHRKGRKVEKVLKPHAENRKNLEVIGYMSQSFLFTSMQWVGLGVGLYVLVHITAFLGPIVQREKEKFLKIVGALDFRE